MNAHVLHPGSGVALRPIYRATIGAIHQDGRIAVTLDSAEGGDYVCDVLQTGAGEQLTLVPADVVLVWIASEEGRQGLILGRVGRSHAAASVPEHERIPDELLIEARQTLTLKCGSGSITIREDGKILIRGTDLVSHATQMNRIKGGAVQIN